MATYLSLYPSMLILPIILIFTNNAELRGKNVIVRTMVHSLNYFIYLFIYLLLIIFILQTESFSCVGLYAGWLSGLLLLSQFLVGSWDFLGATYGVM